MKNDPEFNIRFVQQVENYPVLYDHTLDNYSNKWEVDKAWREISETINETVTNCMSKWVILRNNFNRSLRETPKSGSGSDSKKCYYLSKYMQFLVPYLKARKPKRNFAQLFSEKHSNIANKEKEPIYDEIGEISNITQEDNPRTDEAEENYCQELKLTKLSHFGRKRKSQTQNDFETAFISYVENKRKQQKPVKNPDLEFFNSILPQVDKLNDSDKIKFRIDVLRTLNQFLDKSVNNPEK